MSLLKDLSELVEAGVITQETANSIREYYSYKNKPQHNRLSIVFSILGGILAGLGSILIVAHNWDELSREIKTFFAFFPLLMGQILCGVALTKKQESTAWRESTTVFLFFSVGASMALVSQIYNIPGDWIDFMRTWMLLCLPLVYAMKSSMASLLYLIGITSYACGTGYGSSSRPEELYWVLLLLAVPYYFLLYKKKPRSNFTIFHNWLIPISLVITLGTVTARTEELMIIAYFSLFGLLYLIGDHPLFTRQKAKNNGYRIIGSAGTIILLLAFSYDELWEAFGIRELLFKEVITAPEFFAATLLSVLAAGLLYIRQRNKPLSTIKPTAVVFILFIITFILGLSPFLAAVLINLYTLAIGVLIIQQGAKQNHLGILNYGLAIITALISCRFFDTDLSFVSRGLLFMAVGAGFFAANAWMLKKRKTHE